MRHWLDRYYGRLRKVKLNYVLLNLLNYRKLAHNRRMFRKYGIHRSPLLPLSSEMMPRNGESPWLDRPGAAAAVKQDTRLSTFPVATQEAILRWPENGYMILRNCFSSSEVDAINEEVDRLIRDNVVDFNFTGRKIMFAFPAQRTAEKVGERPTSRRRAGLRARQTDETLSEHQLPHRQRAGGAQRFDPHDHLSARLPGRGVDRT
jgi:hypothetical protein